MINKFNFILLLILILLYLIFPNKKNYSENFDNNLKYYRCNDKKLGIITNNIFNHNNITKTNNNDWIIYMPCGYNYVENELKNISKQKNINNKYIFGINGCDNIVSKNEIWNQLVKCYGFEFASTLMPQTFILYNTKNMEIFKNKFYDKKNIYILKKNVQRKEGLKLTNNLNEILNAKNDNYKVVQKYMTNLYLINKRKVNMRIYLLIIIKKDKKYFYLSSLGKCIYTKKEYNNDNFDFESNITSYNLDLDVYKTNPRSFLELRRFINYEGKHSEILFKLIHSKMVYICKCIEKSVYQSNNIYGATSFQLFGLDFIFDNNLNPYLLEMNKGPDMIPKDEIDTKLKTKIQLDMFNKIGLLNSKNNSFFLIYTN